MSEVLAPRQLIQRLAQIGVLVGLAALLVLTLPGLGDVRHRFADAHAGWVVAALLLEAGSVTAYVVAFRGVFSPPRGWRFSAGVGLSEQAANVLLPAGGAGGLALGAWALRRIGLDSAHIARRTVAFFLITSSANFFVAVAAGIGLLTGVLPGNAGVALAAVPAGLALLVIAGVVLLPRVLPERPSEDMSYGRVRRALAHAGATVAEGLRDTGVLLRAGRPMVIGGAAGYLLFDVAALAAAFHAFGSSLPVGDFLMAYVLGQLGGLIPLPGGVGGTDGGLVAALVLYGAPLTSATVAVLAYRAFQLGLPALAGTVAFADLRRTLARESESWRVAADPISPSPRKRQQVVRRGRAATASRAEARSSRRALPAADQIRCASSANQRVSSSNGNGRLSR